MVDLHHFLSLAILDHVVPRYQLRSSCHFAFGDLLAIFLCYDVHSVTLILHLLSLRQKTWPAYLCFPFLMVLIMSFMPVCYRIQVLLFLACKVMSSMIHSILHWATARFSTMMVLSACVSLA